MTIPRYDRDGEYADHGTMVRYLNHTIVVAEKDARIAELEAAGQRMNETNRLFQAQINAAVHERDVERELRRTAWDTIKRIGAGIGWEDREDDAEWQERIIGMVGRKIGEAINWRDFYELQAQRMMLARDRAERELIAQRELLSTVARDRAVAERQRDALADAVRRALPQARGCWQNHYGDNPEGGPKPTYIAAMEQALGTLEVL